MWELISWDVSPLSEASIFENERIASNLLSARILWESPL